MSRRPESEVSSGGQGQMKVLSGVILASKPQIPITYKPQIPSNNTIIQNKTEVLVSKKSGGVPGRRWTVRGTESQAPLL